MPAKPSPPERIDSDWYDRSAYFDAPAHLRDFDSTFQRYRTAKVLELCDPLPTDRALDLGCGWGTISFALASHVREVVGLDFAERAVASCNDRLDAIGDGTDPGSDRRPANLSFRVGDATGTGLAPASFDLVVAADLFEHLYPEDSEAVAAEALRLLRPGGRFAVWTPCRSHILEVLKNRNIVLRRDESHVDYKSLPRLTGILGRAGFRIARAGYAESHLPGLRTVERALQRWVPLLRRRIAVVAVRPTEASAT